MDDQLRRRLIIDGTEFKLAVNQSGKGAPTTATMGLPGVLYMDENTGALYKCTAADVEAGRYTWTELSQDSYSKAEIDAMLGSYVNDIAAVIGGDA